MMRSEAEAYLDNWYAGTNKIFEYKQEFLPLEYIMIEKIDTKEFKINEKESTTNLIIEHREELVHLLSSRQLIYHTEYTWRTPLEIKTGNCQCGQWVTNNGLHSEWCTKYTKEQK